MRYSLFALMLLSVLTSCQRGPVTILEQAEAHFRNGSWSDAISACDQHLAGDPSNQEAISLRGRSYLAMKQYDRAIDDFTKLIELTPDDCEPLYRRGMAYEGLGQSELAAADNSKARSLDPLKESAYIYDAGNFIEKPQFGGVAVSSEEEDEDGVSETNENDAELLADDERAKRAQLDRDLDQDFYDREAEAEASASAESEEPLSDTLPSTVRSRIRSGGIDDDFVKGAVESYRSLLEEEDRAKTMKSNLPRASAPGLSLDDLLGPDPQTKRDKEQVKMENNDELNRFTPPISTALPPGYIPPGSAVGRQPYSGITGSQVPGGYSVQGGLTPSPVTNNVPGVLGGFNPNTTPNPYQMHANPVYAPGTKPTLSTSIPLGSTGLSGSAVQPRTPVAPLGTSPRLPSMLPPAGTPIETDYP